MPGTGFRRTGSGSAGRGSSAPEPSASRQGKNWATASAPLWRLSGRASGKPAAAGSVGTSRMTAVLSTCHPVDALSRFPRVRCNGHMSARRRLRVTAKPRVFGDGAKRGADDHDAELASMDGGSECGADLFHRGSGWAVENDPLTDRKAVVPAVDEGWSAPRSGKPAKVHETGAGLPPERQAIRTGCGSVGTAANSP